MIDLAIDSRVFISNVVDEALQELDMYLTPKIQN